MSCRRDLPDSGGYSWWSVGEREGASGRPESSHNEELRDALFGSDFRLPMVFQYNPLMHDIEADENGELIFTISRLNILAPSSSVRFRLSASFMLEPSP